MKRTRSTLVALAMLLLYAGVGLKAEEGWSMSKLNPFSKTSSAAKAKPAKAAKPAAQPSTLSKMSNGTKSFFAKTKQTLTPKKSAKSQTTAVSSGNSTGAKKSGFSLWPKKKEEPKKVQTVPEFLNQPRPK